MTTSTAAAPAQQGAVSALANILGGRLPGLPPLPGLVTGNWALIQRSDLDAWLTRIAELETRYSFAGLRDDELEFIAGA